MTCPLPRPAVVSTSRCWPRCCRLPTRQRGVIALRIFLDLDTGTIAQQLGIEAGTGLGLAGTVGVTALALGLTGAFGGYSPARAGTTIRAAAFTLTRNANGTDTLTISPMVLVEPGTLQNDLAQYGIRAMVRTGSFCSSDPAPDWSQVMSFSPKGNGPVRNPTITINPSAMPAGTELSFGYFQWPVGPETALALINTNSYTCTSTAPTAPPAGGALFGRS
jgi:hypothetical protein